MAKLKPIIKIYTNGDIAVESHDNYNKCYPNHRDITYRTKFFKLSNDKVVRLLCLN